MNNVPDPSRNGGRTSLDFLYWVHQAVEDSYDREVPFAMPEVTPHDIELDYSMIRDSLSRTGISLPMLEIDNINLGEIVMEYFTVIPKEQAYRTIGAILYYGGRMAVVAGFGFVIVRSGDAHIYRYMSRDELSEWDLGMVVKGMTYR